MKQTINGLYFVRVLFITVVWLIGCQCLLLSNLTKPNTLISTQTNTYTQTPTNTSTPTLTLTETLTETITPTLSKTLVPTTLGSSILPGAYYFYKCANFVPRANFPGASNVTFCVNVVHVNEAYQIQFSVSWIVYLPYPQEYFQPAFANINSIYLEDNLNNRYQYISATGCATERSWMMHNETQGHCVGTFLFPKAQPNVITFNFIDSSSGVEIDNIVL